MEQTLKDARGHIIGRMNDLGSEVVMKDERGNTVGRYNKGSNMTYDARGNRIGSGNLLAMLLKK